MTFTRSDFVTFALGALAAVLVPVVLKSVPFWIATLPAPVTVKPPLRVVS